LADSTWQGGYCRSTAVKNTGSTAINTWKLQFQLPATAVISQSWSGALTRVGTTVTVTPEAWAAKIAPGQTVTSFGFCVNGSGEPTAATVS